MKGKEITGNSRLKIATVALLAITACTASFAGTFDPELFINVNGYEKSEPLRGGGKLFVATKSVSFSKLYSDELKIRDMLKSPLAKSNCQNVADYFEMRLRAKGEGRKGSYLSVTPTASGQDGPITACHITVVVNGMESYVVNYFKPSSSSSDLFSFFLVPDGE